MENDAILLATSASAITSILVAIAAWSRQRKKDYLDGWQELAKKESEFRDKERTQAGEREEDLRVRLDKVERELEKTRRENAELNVKLQMEQNLHSNDVEKLNGELQAREGWDGKTERRSGRLEPDPAPPGTRWSTSRRQWVPMSDPNPTSHDGEPGQDE